MQQGTVGRRRPRRRSVRPLSRYHLTPRNDARRRTRKGCPVSCMYRRKHRGEYGYVQHVRIGLGGWVPQSSIIGTIKGNPHVMSGNLKLTKTSGRRIEERRERSAPYNASRRNLNARENQHIGFLFPTVGRASLTYPESRCSWKALFFPWPPGGLPLRLV